LRGFHFVAAVTFVAEIGDARRFAHPRALMAYPGLVPSESSSGQTHHQGSITKTGNKHARRILIEAAWNYRHSARISRILEVRQQGSKSTRGPVPTQFRNTVIPLWLTQKAGGNNN
jgi:transposase